MCYLGGLFSRRSAALSKFNERRRGEHKKTHGWGMEGTPVLWANHCPGQAGTWINIPYAVWRVEWRRPITDVGLQV